MSDDDKSLAEQQLESQQRALELGRRYGMLDARAGRPDDVSTAAQMGLSGREAELYAQGHKERYDAYIAKLEVYGTVVSVPSLVPGERMSAVTTGHTRVTAMGDMFVEVATPGATTTLWLPVNRVMVIR